MNSVASIARPSGITTTAGPGNTIMATPIIRAVKPATITIRRLAWPYVLMMRCFTIQSPGHDTSFASMVTVVFNSRDIRQPLLASSASFAKETWVAPGMEALTSR